MARDNPTTEPSCSVGFRLPGVSDMVHEDDRKPMPKWVPVSLLALTTLAFAVPVVLMRRQWSSTVVRSVKDDPPPRRGVRTSGENTVPSRAVASTRTTSPLPPPPRPKTSTIAQEASVVGAEDDFNGALYSAKAFGIATMIVTTSAVSIVWGIKLAMGVQDTEEFAHRMRQAIITYMPGLSSRIHRSPKPEDNPQDWDANAPDSYLGAVATQWSWPSAEERLTTAFRERGFSGWAEAAMRELEAEGRMEREKRESS